MDFSDETFNRQTINIDGNSYARCTFNECTLIYSGGNPPQFDACKIVNVVWRFADSAKRAVNFLRDIASVTAKGQAVFDNRMDIIKSGPRTTEDDQISTSQRFDYLKTCPVHAMAVARIAATFSFLEVIL